MFRQILCHDGRRDAGKVELPVQVHPRRDDCGLDRVQHVEAGGHVAEGMPGLFAVRRLHSFGIGLFQHPVGWTVDAFFVQLFRSPNLEPPVVAVFFIHLAHRAPEIERLEQAFFDQSAPARRLHHRRGHVATGDDAVLRAGRGVHQIRLVEQVPVEFGVLAVLHEHMACLRNPRQKLVNGLG